MSLPTITIVGALGSQGSGVLSAFLNDEVRKFNIRALTSDVNSTSAQALKEMPNVTVLHVDLNSVSSIEEVFKGSSYIFANTIFNPTTFMEKGAAEAEKLEAQHGINIVRAASMTASLKHFIWSSLPNAEAATNGRFYIPHFQSKIPAEKFILDHKNGLRMKSTILRVAMYGSNLQRIPYQPLVAKESTQQSLVLPCSPDAYIPFIGDERWNVGVFAKAIIEQPDLTLGRFVDGSSEYISVRDWAKAHEAAQIHAGLDVKIICSECTLEDYEHLWGAIGSEIGIMIKYFAEYGKSSYTMAMEGDAILTAMDLGVQSKLRRTETEK